MKDKDQTAPDALNIPPPELRYRVAGTEGADWFHQSGKRSLEDYTRALATAFPGSSVEDFKTILDFGCGCGRMARWILAKNKNCALTGADIDEPAVQWCRDNLAGGVFLTTGELPSLPITAASFSLVYSQSVLTHLDEAHQDRWLAELARVAEPGAVLLLSTHGETAWNKFKNSSGDTTAFRQLETRMENDGIVFVSDDNWGREGYFPDYYHTTFHKKDYVAAHWSKWVDVLNIVEAGSIDYQDIVVCQNRK